MTDFPFNNDRDLLVHLYTSLQSFQVETKEDLKEIKKDIAEIKKTCACRINACDERYVSNKEINAVRKTGGVVGGIVAFIISAFTFLFTYFRH